LEGQDLIVRMARAPLSPAPNGRFRISTNTRVLREHYLLLVLPLKVRLTI
jgi:hypothetical protein